MDRFWTLKFFITVSLLGGVCHGWTATYAMGLVKAIKGSCVLLPCRTVPYSKVEWYYYKSSGYPVVYADDRSTVLKQFRGRTRVPRSRNGDCSLTIDNVQQEDGKLGYYVWVWKSNGENKGFYDQTIKIDVVEPRKPTMSVNSQQVEGRSFTASCMFLHSCHPDPPSIEWLGLRSISISLSSTPNGDGLTQTTSTATFRVTQQDQGIRLECRSTLNGQSFTSNPVSLDVRYAPKNVKIEYPSSTTVVEGNKITLRCTSTSHRAATQYKWVVTHNSVRNQYTGETVTLQDVRRDTSVSCVAVNNIGEVTSQQLLLDVHYAPVDVRVVYTGRNTVVEGNTIELSCSSKGRPAPTHYEWLVNYNTTTTTILYTTDTVVLRNVMRDTSVSCIAINTIGRATSQQHSLHVHYAPSIFPGSFCSTQDGLLKCACQAEAKPRVGISWSVDGSVALHPIFNVTTRVNGSVTMSQLIGPQGNNVNCTAKNSVGSIFIEIPVSHEGKNWIPVLSGAAGGCVFLLLLMTAILVIIKRRRTKTSDVPRTMQNVRPKPVCHDYNTQFDGDIYANDSMYANTDQASYEEQDNESCIYENFDINS